MARTTVLQSVAATGAGDTDVALTAVTATGANIATANTLAVGFNLVTAGAASTGVILPSGSPGRVVTVKYNGSVAGGLFVYPHTGGTINALAANTCIAMGNLSSAVFTAFNSVAWYSTPLLPS